MVEFIDCGSLSISYDATGKATISFNVITDTNDLANDYTNQQWGSVRYDCIMTNVTQRPILGSNGWYEWSLQLEGVTE